MAYQAYGYRTGINYYSNPDIIWSITKAPLGVQGKINNARNLMANRFALAACGSDEPEGRCNSCDYHPEAWFCMDCCDEMECTIESNSWYPMNFHGSWKVDPSASDPSSPGKKV